MKLALAPIPFYWPKERVLAFYQDMARQPVDIVYLGETVCSRRHELQFDDWLTIADQLTRAGKEVVLSTSPLIESEGDLKIVRRAVANGRFLVEANDMGAVRLLAEKSLPFVAGATLNVFNSETLRLLVAQGAMRWVMPPEIGRNVLSGLQAQRPEGLATEVLVHGPLALAHSARCFTARRFNLQKEACTYRCLDFPRGLPLQTRDGETFLVLNGTQILSARTYDLWSVVEELRALGADILRLTPDIDNTAAIIDRFRAAREGGRISEPADRETICNGFWYGRPGLELVSEGAS